MDMDGPFPLFPDVQLHKQPRVLWSEYGPQGTMGQASYKFLSLWDAIFPASHSLFSFGFRQKTRMNGPKCW